MSSGNILRNLVSRSGGMNSCFSCSVITTRTADLGAIFEFIIMSLVAYFNPRDTSVVCIKISADYETMVIKSKRA